jgi:hypothetical protein
MNEKIINLKKSKKQKIIESVIHVKSKIDILIDILSQNNSRLGNNKHE